MKKKIFTLLTLLVCLCTGAWATSYIPTTVKTIGETQNILMGDLDGTGTWYKYGTTWGLKTNQTVTVTDSDFGTPTGGSDNTLEIKVASGTFETSGRVFHMLVKGITAVKALGAVQSERGIKIGVTEYSEGMESSTNINIVAGNEETSNPVSTDGLDATKTYLVSILAFQKDKSIYLYGVRFTAGTLPTYSVTYDLNGGSGTTPTEANKYEGAVFTLHDGTTEITAPTDKAFTGWLCNIDENVYSGGAEYTMTAAATTFTAQWSTVYNITYQNGGHGTAPDATSGAVITLPTMDAVTGYQNTGWTADKTVVVNGENVAAGTTIPVDTEVTLTASTTFTGVWSEVYNVIYDLNGGSGTTPTEDAQLSGAVITLHDGTTDITAPDGYSFRGWFCNIDKKIYAGGAEYAMTAASTTFKAKYENVIIKATVTGKDAVEKSGSLNGTVEAKISSNKKFDKGCYIGLTLSDATFSKGDIINVCITEACTSGNAYIKIYDSDKTTVLYNTETAGVVGENRFVLPEAVDEKSALYICRVNGVNDWNAYVSSVSVIRPENITLNTSGYGTFSYDEPVQLYGASSAKAYTADLDYNNSQITCASIADNKVPAGNGVLVYGEASEKVYIIPVTSADALSNNDLKGTTNASGELVEKGSNSYFVLSGSTFMPYSGDAFTANKAYFEVSGTEVQGRDFSIVFSDNETTGINAVQGSESRVQSGVYNLAGQRVENPTKGLYIVNGRKVVIK